MVAALDCALRECVAWEQTQRRAPRQKGCFVKVSDPRSRTKAALVNRAKHRTRKWRTTCACRRDTACTIQYSACKAPTCLLQLPWTQKAGRGRIRRGTRGNHSTEAGRVPYLHLRVAPRSCSSITLPASMTWRERVPPLRGRNVGCMTAHQVCHIFRSASMQAASRHHSSHTTVCPDVHDTCREGDSLHGCLMPTSKFHAVP